MLLTQPKECQATGRCGHRPLRDEREAPSTALASGAGRSICASGRKGWVGHAAESIPEVSSNLGQSLSRPPGDSSLCTREPCPMGDGRAGGHIGPPLRGHRNSQQRQTGRDRARPLQKGGEYAEGWGDERPMPVRDLPGCRQLRFPQSGVLGMTTGAKASSSHPTSQCPP